ncbi:MAG: ammonium transporter [Cyclobacteriaceae bacterium]
MKKIILGLILLCPFFTYAQSSTEINKNLVRIERKTNATEAKVQANTDSINAMSSRLDVQYLEIQSTKIYADSAAAKVGQDIQRIKDEVGIVETSNIQVKTELDRFWILIAAALIFLMQAGFKVLEMGMVREIHGTGIGLKNLVDFVVVAVIYFLVGFSFMFGYSGNGLIGTGFFLPDAAELEILFNEGIVSFGMEFFIFQMAFAATAATIVSGAMSERTALMPYLLIAFFTAGFIYPIVGHMIWGDLFLTDGKAWLSGLGFIDFAGSTVVHSTGAWIALIGVWIIGPRIGRFRLDGSVNNQKFKPYSLGYSVLGVFLLWFGWWGFNGGSTLTFNSNVSNIINNTNLAGAFAAITALIQAYIFDKENVTVKLIGGVLGGLVAITASAAVVDSVGAVLIGIVAGLIHNFGFDLLLKFKLDDPVGAIPVHGFCGVWGTLSVGIFGNEKYIREYLNLAPDAAWTRGDQIITQLIGAGVVLIFVSVASFIFFKIIDVLIGLRVDPTKENSGYIFISGETDSK